MTLMASPEGATGKYSLKSPATGAACTPVEATKSAATKSEGEASASAKSPSGSMNREESVSVETVGLISCEGKHVDVPVHIAKECELLERMLAGSFQESGRRELNLPNIRHRTLCRAVDYLRRRSQWREGGGAPLEFEVDDDIAVDLLVAADYLGMK